MKIESQQLRRLIREAIEDQVGDSLSKDIDARIASLSNEQQEMLYGIRASGDIPQFFSLLDTLTLDDDSFDSYEYFMSPAGFENSIPGMSMLKKEDVFMYDVLITTLLAEQGIVLFLKIDDNISREDHNALYDKIQANQIDALDNPQLLSIYSLRARRPITVTGRRGPFSTMGPDQEELEDIMNKLAEYSNKSTIEIERKILEYVREYSDYNPNYYVELKTS
tara:strand:+ start:597 stop:1262 length:666 start_codon:yes stop_codon:yes gene_type:complete